MYSVLVKRIPGVPFAYVPDPGRPDLVIDTMHLQLVSVK